MTRLAETITIPSGTAKLTVRLYALPAAETIILLHGGPGVPDEMTEVRECLEGFMQVITFDQRGIGADKKPSEGFSMADYLSDINHIAAYFSIDRFHLFGHSWGGLYAQLFASEFPQKVLSLFLCSPASGTGKIWTLTEQEVFHYNRARSSFFEWLGMGFNAALGRLGSGSAYRRLFRQIILNYHKGFNVEPPDPEKLARINAMAGRKTRNAIRKHPPVGIFGKTPFPVIITYGQFDAYGKSKEYVLERFPFAQTAIIPASGHTPWKHNLKEFTRVLRNFYSPHPARGA